MENNEPVFILFAKLAEKDGVAPLVELPGLWHRKIGDSWEFFINAHKDDIETPCGCPVPPFNAYVIYNGWPAGLLAPYGGCFAAGSAANMDIFIKEINDELAK